MKCDPHHGELKGQRRNPLGFGEEFRLNLLAIRLLELHSDGGLEITSAVQVGAADRLAMRGAGIRLIFKAGGVDACVKAMHKFPFHELVQQKSAALQIMIQVGQTLPNCM